MEKYDVVVIGSGPAGEGAAMMLSKNHRKVAVIERYREVGGGCTHWGTIPSKALRHAVKTMADVRANPLLGKLAFTLNVTLPQLLSTANGVIDAQVQMRRRLVGQVLAGYPGFPKLSPSVSVQASHASPLASASRFDWVGFEADTQLSQGLPTKSRSPSASVESAFCGQLSTRSATPSPSDSRFSVAQATGAEWGGPELGWVAALSPQVLRADTR